MARKKILTSFVLGLIPLLAACSLFEEGKTAEPDAAANEVDYDALLRARERELEGERIRSNELLTRLNKAESELVLVRGAVARPPQGPPHRLEQPGIEVDQRGRETIVRVEGDLLFASGRHTLTTGGQGVINKVVSVIKQDYASGSIRVEGHCDSDPIRHSKNHCNTELAFKRAHTVMHHMVKNGVSEKRMTVVSHGEHHPRDPKNKSRNRRVEIIIVRN